MTTALFHYLHVSNTPVGSRLFVKVTDPGKGDPAITRLGFDIRQCLYELTTYTYTAFDGMRSVTLAWLNVSADGMNISFGYNGQHDIAASDLPGIVAKLITSRPELRHPASALEAVGELQEEEVFIHTVDNDTDEEIPFNGWPVPGNEWADDYGLQPEF